MSASRMTDRLGKSVVIRSAPSRARETDVTTLDRFVFRRYGPIGRCDISCRDIYITTRPRPKGSDAQRWNASDRQSVVQVG